MACDERRAASGVVSRNHPSELQGEAERGDLMSEKKSVNTSDISFINLLTVLFIGLKLTGHIDWSWWWVLSPLWLALVIIMVLAVLAVAIGATVKR